MILLMCCCVSYELVNPVFSLWLQLVLRPDVVEMHDVTSRDPKLLVHLKVSLMYYMSQLLKLFHISCIIMCCSMRSLFNVVQSIAIEESDVPSVIFLCTREISAGCHFWRYQWLMPMFIIGDIKNKNGCDECKVIFVEMMTMTVKIQNKFSLTRDYSRNVWQKWLHT